MYDTNIYMYVRIYVYADVMSEQENRPEQKHPLGIDDTGRGAPWKQNKKRNEAIASIFYFAIIDAPE